MTLSAVPDREKRMARAAQAWQGAGPFRKWKISVCLLVNSCLFVLYLWEENKQILVYRRAVRTAPHAATGFKSSLDKCLVRLSPEPALSPGGGWENMAKCGQYGKMRTIWQPYCPHFAVLSAFCRIVRILPYCPHIAVLSAFCPKI